MAHNAVHHGVVQHSTTQHGIAHHNAAHHGVTATTHRAPRRAATPSHAAVSQGGSAVMVAAQTICVPLCKIKAVGTNVVKCNLFSHERSRVRHPPAPSGSHPRRWLSEDPSFSLDPVIRIFARESRYPDDPTASFSGNTPWLWEPRSEYDMIKRETPGDEATKKAEAKEQALRAERTASFAMLW
ncbi:hypothetical protein K449DRAFT_436841 [Hypoxylon sp. EC38]|nr:hypothetical protein K449DRAFT_436841 [Hypoxylon sp. EC38]